MKGIIRFILVIFIVLSLIICETKEKQKVEWKGTIKKEDGVIVVKNPKEPLYDEDVFSLEEELSIGQ